MQLDQVSIPHMPPAGESEQISTPWIRSFGWDAFWMLSGFWVPCLFLLLPQHSAKSLILLVTLCFWIGHRLSSVYLGLCVGEYREVLRARKGYFFTFPLLLFGGLMAFVLCPQSLLPLPPLERFLLLGLLDYFFSLYHFAVQHYGVLSVYRGKLPHGQKDPGLLRWDWWLCLSVSGLFSVVLDALNGELNQFHLFRNPALVDVATLTSIKLSLSLLLLLGWGWTLKLYRQKQQGLARSLYFSSLCFMSLVSFFVEPFLYFALVQIQHWFVSLGLTTYMAGNSRYQATGRSWYRPWSWINGRTGGPLLILTLLSISLTPILEADYFIGQGFSSQELIVKHFLDPFAHSGWIYVFGGLAFFSAFVHYIYDRGVFRFADPITRQAALKLLKPTGKA